MSTAATAADLLGALHKGFAYYIGFTIEREGGAPKASRFPVDKVIEWIAANSRKHNCYLSAAQIDLSTGLKKKFAKTDMARAKALWVDIDPEGGDRFEPSRAEALAALMAYHLPPSCIVDSGNGYQAWWFLQHSESDHDAVERRNQHLSNTFANGDHCWSIDHIMRMPDTLNLMSEKKRKNKKYPEGDRMARIVFWKPENRYDIRQFESAAPPESQALEPVTSGKPKALSPAEWNARRETVERLYNTFSIETLRDREVPEECLTLLEHGDDGTYNGDNSDMLCAIAGYLQRAGLSPEETCAVLGTKFAGCEHVWSAPKKDRWRRMYRAVNAAVTDDWNAKKRAAATAAGIPIWRDTYDKAGLFPKPTLTNATLAVEAIGVKAKLDLFHEVVLFGYEGDLQEVKERVVGEQTDLRLQALRDIIDERFGFDFGATNIHDAVKRIALRNAFDPVLDYLVECQGKWDGVKRIDTWTTDYLGVPDSPLVRGIGLVALIGAVRRARHPGCDHQVIITLEGPEGTNKSKTIRTLAGPENFSDQTILGVSDREAQELLHGVWLFECAELAGVGKRDVEHVKAFASRTTDRARKAYGRIVEKQPRRCAMFATTNERNYLLSRTGNRRFLPLATTVIDLEAIARDRDQLWAEAATREAAGESHVLDPSLWEAARDAQEERLIQDPWEDTLANMPGQVPDPRGRGYDDVPIIFEYGDEQRVLSSDIYNYVLRLQPGLRWSRLSEQIFRVGKWRLCRG